MRGRRAIRRNWRTRVNDVFTLATGAMLWRDGQDDPEYITVEEARAIYDRLTETRHRDPATMYEWDETGEVEIHCWGREGIREIEITFREGGFPQVEVSPEVKADCARMIAEFFNATKHRLYTGQRVMVRE